MMAGNAYTHYDFDSIQTVTVGSGGQSTISFTSIPATYTHLQVRITAKSARTGSAEDTTLIAFNNVTSAASYASHQLRGDGSTAVSGSVTSTYTGLTGILPTSTTSNIFGVQVIDILDYANTNKNKTTRCLMGNDQNGSGYTALYSNLFLSTSAISRIDFTTVTASNFSQYSSFALYGIK